MVWRVGLSSTVSPISASPVAASSAATAQPSRACAQLNQNSVPRSTAKRPDRLDGLAHRRSPSAELVGHRAGGGDEAPGVAVARWDDVACTSQLPHGFVRLVGERGRQAQHRPHGSDGAGTGDRHGSLVLPHRGRELELARPARNVAAPDQRRAQELVGERR